MFVAEIEEGEKIVFLTADQVDVIHGQALLTGGLPGYLNRHYLDGALTRPQNAEHYEGIRDIIVLAAYLWHGMSTSHVFCDGNKRTALLTCVAFLGANGVEIDPSTPKAEPAHFINGCFAADKLTIDVFAQYLRTRCRWIET